MSYLRNLVFWNLKCSYPEMVYLNWQIFSTSSTLTIPWNCPRIACTFFLFYYFWLLFNSVTFPWYSLFSANIRRMSRITRNKSTWFTRTCSKRFFFFFFHIRCQLSWVISHRDDLGLLFNHLSNSDSVLSVVAQNWCWTVIQSETFSLFQVFMII